VATLVAGLQYSLDTSMAIGLAILGVELPLLAFLATAGVLGDKVPIPGSTLKFGGPVEVLPMIIGLLCGAVLAALPASMGMAQRDLLTRSALALQVDSDCWALCAQLVPEMQVAARAARQRRIWLFGSLSVIVMGLVAGLSTAWFDLLNSLNVGSGLDAALIVLLSAGFYLMGNLHFRGKFN
jgi:hypothetical protein